MKLINKENFKGIFLSLIVSVIVFIGLLIGQQSILNPNGTTIAYIATSNIGKGTLITNDNIGKLFKTKKVDGELEVDNAIKSKRDLLNKIVNVQVNKGQVVSANEFIDKESVLAKIENPVEASFKATDISQVVGGTIRTGDMINISTINQVTKENENVLNNVYVNRTFSNEGKEVNRGDTTPVVAINILISKDDEAKLNKALGTGQVRVSKIDK
ncbi:SAF domain-containing protein [Clostridium paridis]|uniref:SAF domain-containing protein n=1 Tax=Clostridium paridis TaxID=2803863 RepID=A0A937FIV3_9CLOT|nr:SAF domain-containing protein [Clostridium paridis]MBL4932271.1 SAF domain-containing protein [Clostridium paridis]